MSDDDLLIGAIAGIIIAVGILALIKPRTDLPPAAAPKTTYNNLEEWEFIKDGRGRVSGVKVHRHAEST